MSATNVPNVEHTNPRTFPGDDCDPDIVDLIADSEEKAQIQANNPIIIKLKSNSTTHFVVGVGDTGNGASTSELIVLEPGNGRKYTLQEAMNYNSMTAVMNYILTKRY
mgnify:CR=1 FL=1